MFSRLFDFRHALELILALAFAASIASAQNTAKLNAQVIAINPASGVVTARDLATGGSFDFRVQNAAVLKSLKPGQQLYANFAAKQVSLDGRTVAGQIISGPLSVQGSPASTSRTAPQTVQPSTGPQPILSAARPGPASLPAVSPAATTQPANDPQPAPITIPAMTIGAVHRATPPPATLPLAHARQINATVNGTPVSAEVVHVRGIDGIEQSDLPDDVKQLLIMHAQTLEAGESDHYIVNRQLAEQWTKAHPLPASLKKKSGGNSHAGCHALSTHCASEATKHAEYEAERQAEALRREALGEWKHLSDELTRDWKVASECFVDHTLEAAAVTVPAVGLQPSLPPLSFEQSKSSKHSGMQARGSVRLGFDIGEKDFQTRVAMFYIPCIPYAFRPKRIEASGTLTLGSHIEGDVTAAGQFSYTFKIPPSGGVPVELFEFPILVAGVPVSEVRVSSYFEGDINVAGNGTVDGHVALNSQHETAFKMHCDGHGCAFDSHEVPTLQASTPERMAMQGKVHVEPSIYSAIQVDVDYDALSARAGLKPFLSGEVDGCSIAAGTATGTRLSGQDDYALTADLDWGADLIAQAYAGKKKLADQTMPLVKKDSKESHLEFWDLGHVSNALTPAVLTMKQAVAGQATAFKLKMPACYPYADSIQYDVRWTGGATAAVGQLAATTAGAAPVPCKWQAGAGVCYFDPQKDLTLNLTWPQAGSYTVSVMPVTDMHGRKFGDGTQHTTQVTIAVQGQVAKTQ